MNPVARSNVCPEINPPSVPSFHAFGFTIEAMHASPTFVIAGSGEAPEGSIGSYAERAVRSGETSADAIREKARFVLGEMERRLSALGFGWLDTTVVQIYTLLNIRPEIGPTKRGKGMKIMAIVDRHGLRSRSARMRRTITKSAWCSSASTST